MNIQANLDDLSAKIDKLKVDVEAMKNRLAQSTVAADIQRVVDDLEILGASMREAIEQYQAP